MPELTIVYIPTDAGSIAQAYNDMANSTATSFSITTVEEGVFKFNYIPPAPAVDGQ